MGDRFYLQRDRLTLSLQPDKKPVPKGPPTYYQSNPVVMYPIPGKTYFFNRIPRIFTANGWSEVELPANPRLGQVSKKDGKSVIYFEKKGWTDINTLF